MSRMAIARLAEIAIFAMPIQLEAARCQSFIPPNPAQGGKERDTSLAFRRVKRRVEVRNKLLRGITGLHACRGGSRRQVCPSGQRSFMPLELHRHLSDVQVRKPITLRLPLITIRFSEWQPVRMTAQRRARTSSSAKDTFECYSEQVGCQTESGLEHDRVSRALSASGSESNKVPARFGE